MNMNNWTRGNIRRRPKNIARVLLGQDYLSSDPIFYTTTPLSRDLCKYLRVSGIYVT